MSTFFFRLCLTDDVFGSLVDGATYNVLGVTGHDGQSGRGSSGIRGKVVNDGKWKGQKFL